MQGIDLLYVSGWQLAAERNDAHKMYPDLGLYPANTGPNFVAALTQSLQAKDRMTTLENKSMDWFKPILIDIEAGFGGSLNVFELTQNLIRAGVAGVHLEDQLTSERRCGHLGGKVIVPVNIALNVKVH